MVSNSLLLVNLKPEKDRTFRRGCLASWPLCGTCLPKRKKKAQLRMVIKFNIYKIIVCNCDDLFYKVAYIGCKED